MSPELDPGLMSNDTPIRQNCKDPGKIFLELFPDIFHRLSLPGSMAYRIP
jgi:hypothetical protein